MKIKLLLGVLLVMLFATLPASAQRYRHDRHHGYRSGYHHRQPRAVIVVNPGHRHRDSYRRGYNRGYRSASYSRGHRNSYGSHRHGHYDGPRRHGRHHRY